MISALCGPWLRREFHPACRDLPASRIRSVAHSGTRFGDLRPAAARQLYQLPKAIRGLLARWHAGKARRALPTTPTSKARSTVET